MVAYFIVGIYIGQTIMKYETLDDQTFYGEIVGFQGVYANADTEVGSLLKFSTKTNSERILNE